MDKKRIESIKEKYGFSFFKSFELPLGYCHGDTDGLGNFYFQQGFFPDENFTSIIVKNVFDGKVEKIEIDSPGIRYIRLARDSIYASGAFHLNRCELKTGEKSVIGTSGLNDGEYLVPSDFQFLQDDLLLSDLNTSRIIRYDAEDKIRDTYFMSPYCCPLAIKIIDQHKLILVLRSFPLTSMRRRMDKRFHDLPPRFNQQRHNLVILDISSRTVVPFIEAYAAGDFGQMLRDSTVIHDIEVDYPYLYIILFYREEHYLVKYDLKNQSPVFYYNFSNSLKKGIFQDCPGIWGMGTVALFSLKVFETPRGKFLLFLGNFRVQGATLPKKTVGFVFRVFQGK